MPTTLNEGFVVCCSLCDSYLVLTTGGVTPADWRGKNMATALADRNEALQLEWERKRWVFARCPTCVSLVTGVPYQDWQWKFGRDPEALTPLRRARESAAARNQHPLDGRRGANNMTTPTNRCLSQELAGVHA